MSVAWQQIKGQGMVGSCNWCKRIVMMYWSLDRHGDCLSCACWPSHPWEDFRWPLPNPYEVRSETERNERIVEQLKHGTATWNFKWTPMPEWLPSLPPLKLHLQTERKCGILEKEEKMTFKIYDGAPKPEKQEIGIAIRPSSWREGFDILLVDPHTGQPIGQAELLCLQPKSDGKLDVYFYKSPNPGFVRRDGRGEMAIGC